MIGTGLGPASADRRRCSSVLLARSYTKCMGMDRRRGPACRSPPSTDGDVEEIVINELDIACGHHMRSKCEVHLPNHQLEMLFRFR